MKLILLMILLAYSISGCAVLKAHDITPTVTVGVKHEPNHFSENASLSLKF